MLRHGIAELFAGVGSVADGFSRGGPFQPVYLNDVDPSPAATYRVNRGEKGGEYDVRDVRQVTAADVLKAADGRQVSGVLGCPPCQGWSAAGRRLADDERNMLIGDYFRLVRDLRPLFFVMENVPAVSGRPELRRALATEARGYRCWSGVLNAASYGLPQTRQRTLVLGYREDLGVRPTPPPPTHAGRREVWDYRREALVAPTAETLDSLLGSAPTLYVTGTGSAHTMRGIYAARTLELADLVTVGDAIGDLDEDPPSRSSAYARAMRTAGGPPANHVPWGHGEDLVRRMSTVVEGCRPPLTATNGRRYYSQAYARLHRRGLGRTITTNFHNPGSGRFLHYARPRTLSVREAARLQGFSDDFVFTGHRGHQARMVGNAFPPLWAEAIARHVSDELADALSA